MKAYPVKVLVALDVFAATVLGFSSADCTISACCGLALRGQRGGTVEKLLGRVLNAIWPGHTARAIRDDAYRAKQALCILSPPNP